MSMLIGATPSYPAPAYTNLSPAAPDAVENASGAAVRADSRRPVAQNTEGTAAKEEKSGNSSTDKREALKDPNSPESKQLEELKARDREVRTHEQAHLAAAGQYARGGPSYSYQQGPDGKRYAVGGEVKIDTSPVPGDPEATIRKAQQVRRAALAPAEPSSTDRAVASQASAMAAQAQAELMKQRLEEGRGGGENSPAGEEPEDKEAQRNLEQLIQASGATGSQESSSFSAFA